MDTVSAAAAVLIEDLGGRAVRKCFSSAITAAGISVPDVVGWACLVEASACALLFIPVLSSFVALLRSALELAGTGVEDSVRVLFIDTTVEDWLALARAAVKVEVLICRTSRSGATASAVANIPVKEISDGANIWARFPCRATDTLSISVVPNEVCWAVRWGKDALAF